MVQNEDYAGQAFTLLGGVNGVRMLANTFYDVMEELPGAQKIRAMHPEDLSETRENLTLFLCGWLGGPQLYRDKFGSANLANIHIHFDIDTEERDMWISCMDLALEKQPFEEKFKKYLLKRFKIPAERIRITCQQQLKGFPVVLPPDG